MLLDANKITPITPLLSPRGRLKLFALLIENRKIDRARTMSRSRQIEKYCNAPFRLRQELA
eukprot:5652160-Alexandrium_andersonii.AAC.1